MPAVTGVWRKAGAAAGAALAEGALDMAVRTGAHALTTSSLKTLAQWAAEVEPPAELLSRVCALPAARDAQYAAARAEAIGALSSTPSAPQAPVWKALAPLFAEDDPSVVARAGDALAKSVSFAGAKSVAAAVPRVLELLAQPSLKHSFGAIFQVGAAVVERAASGRPADRAQVVAWAGSTYPVFEPLVARAGELRTRTAGKEGY